MDKLFKSSCKPSTTGISLPLVTYGPLDLKFLELMLWLTTHYPLQLISHFWTESSLVSFKGLGGAVERVLYVTSPCEMSDLEWLRLNFQRGWLTVLPVKWFLLQEEHSTLHFWPLILVWCSQYTTLKFNALLRKASMQFLQCLPSAEAQFKMTYQR